MRLITFLFWLTPPALALALYAPTLTLPFFWDDVANFQFMFGRSLAEMWVASPGFPYYRPLTFGLWRALQVVFGAITPWPFHALNLVTLIGCGWAVGWLASALAAAQARSTDDRQPMPQLAGWLAGMMMTTFPFAALVVPLVASLFHLCVTLILTLACVCALKYDQTRRPAWAIGAVALAAFAPFAHESGMTAGLLMVVCVAARVLLIAGPAPKFVGQLKARRAGLAVAGLGLLANLAFIPWWQSVPKRREVEGFEWVGWESIAQSIVFFFEGLTYPVQFLAQPLMRLGVNDFVAVLGLGGAALALAWLALSNRRWLVWALAFNYLAALPAIVALPFSYTIVSPRLMVVAAPAACILWAMVAVQAAQRWSRPTAATRLAAAGAVAACLVPAGHIAREVRLHQLALDHLWQFVDQLEANPGHSHLVVNPMNWIAPVNATYALGHEGVEVMPGYLTPQLIAWVHTQALFQVEGVTFPLVFPELTDIYFSTWGEALHWEAMAARVREADRVWLVRYGDARIELAEAGRVVPGEGQPLVNFSDRIWLTRHDADLAGRAIELRLHWRVRARSSEDVFANALDCHGGVLGLSSGAGLGGVYPIWLWQPGESIHEVRRIPLDRLSPDGCYRVELGLFDPAGGARVEAFDAAGAPLENFLVVIQFSR